MEHENLEMIYQRSFTFGFCIVPFNINLSYGDLTIVISSEKRRVEAEASNAEEERDRLQTELQELRRRDSNVAESEEEVKGKMRDEEWRKKVEEEQQKQSKEMQKLKDELAKRVQRRDEEWRTKVEKELAVKNAEIEKLQRERGEFCMTVRDRPNTVIMLHFDGNREVDTDVINTHLAQSLFDLGQSLFALVLNTFESVTGDPSFT
uniref:UBX domain-containing protein n=1 Tax=Parascaris equorum TaxID=6256 RepID=A0A914RYI8_PAREQ